MRRVSSAVGVNGTRWSLTDHLLRSRCLLRRPHPEFRHSSTHSPTLPTSPRHPRWRPLVLAFIVGLTLPTSCYFLWPSDDTRNTPLNPTTFTPFTLISRVPVSSTSSIYTLRPPHSSSPATLNDGEDQKSPYEDLWRRGIWSVQFKQPQLQIARSYTPLPFRPSAPVQWPLTANLDQGPEVTTEPVNGHSDLYFLIRHDPRGEVSSYLSRLLLGSQVEVRGPKVEYSVPEDIERVVFIAGGTGVVPVMQMLKTLQSRGQLEEHRERADDDQQGSGRKIRQPQERNGREGPRIDLLWANRRREDCQGGLSAENSKPQTRWSIPSIFSLGKAYTSSTPPQSTISSAPPLSPNPVISTLNDLQSRNPRQLSISYFVDEEGSYITASTLKKCLSVSPSNPPLNSKDQANKSPNEHRKGQRLIIISGPEGFVRYLAGDEKRPGERGPRCGGLLGNLEVEREGWKIVRL